MEPVAKPTRTTPLALVAIGLGVLGLCFFPIQIITVALAVVALQKIKKDPSQGGRSLAITALALSGASVLTTAILAAVAIPAFISYMRRARTEEARTQVLQIANRVNLQTSMRVAAHDGTPVVFPPSIALTPSAPSCEPVRWPLNAPAGWTAVGYLPDGFFRYAYELRTSADGRTATVRAEGDLDCDGLRSVYQLRLFFDASGEPQHDAEIHVENELE